jgi:hypothetical protein
MVLMRRNDQLATPTQEIRTNPQIAFVKYTNTPKYAQIPTNTHYQEEIAPCEYASILAYSHTRILAYSDTCSHAKIRNSTWPPPGLHLASTWTPPGFRTSTWPPPGLHLVSGPPPGFHLGSTWPPLRIPEDPRAAPGDL